LAGCEALRVLARNHYAWILAITASGTAGALLAGASPLPGPWSLVAAAASLLLALAGSLTVYRNLRVRRRRVEALCRACGDPLYWPRKTAVVCGRGETILCYTYALDRYYAVKPEGPTERVPGSPWTPTDYYCVKLLGGRLEEAPGGARAYRGRFEALAPSRWHFLRGRGAVVYAGGDADPEGLARIAEELAGGEG